MPTIGAAYIAKAFITVITGGAAILSGTLVGLRPARHGRDRRHLPVTPVLGEVALLVAAVVLLRLLPRASPAAFSGGRCDAQLPCLGIALAAAMLAALRPAAGCWDLPLINSTIFVSMAILALSLALIWGFGGILCFGQAAFFGLGGYAYAVAAINFGDTTAAVPIALACRRCWRWRSAISCSTGASATSIWASSRSRRR